MTECLRLQQLQTGRVGTTATAVRVGFVLDSAAASQNILFVLSPSMPVPLHKPKSNVDCVLLHAVQLNTH